jgi:hypothetical protein
MDASRLRNLSRIAWIATGLAALVWLTLEDRGVAGVQLVAVAIAASGLIGARSRRGKLQTFRWWIPAGLIAGLAVAPLAGLLLLTKIGAHGHPVPDFSLADLAAAASGMPRWLAVGGLAGAGAALWDRARGTPEVQ